MKTLLNLSYEEIIFAVIPTFGLSSRKTSPWTARYGVARALENRQSLPQMINCNSPKSMVKNTVVSRCLSILAILETR